MACSKQKMAKNKWTKEEEEALIAGVLKHGQGFWKKILQDPEFSDTLGSRSNVNIKDKWRNLSSGFQVPEVPSTPPATVSIGTCMIMEETPEMFSEQLGLINRKSKYVYALESSRRSTELFADYISQPPTPSSKDKYD